MTVINFNNVEPLIKSSYTIDELITMYREMQDVYNMLVRQMNESERVFSLCSVAVDYICNAVVMYHTLELFKQMHGGWELDIDYWHDLDGALYNVFLQMVEAREIADERTTTVVEQLVAGAGIDFSERIVDDTTEKESRFHPIIGDSRTSDVVSYGVEAVLDSVCDKVNAVGTSGIRKWLLDRIKHNDQNFTLNFTWK